MYLENVDRRSISGRNLSRGSGPQGPRRPRFSFFRFTFQTARDSGESLSSVGRRAVEALSFRPRPEAFHRNISEVLRGRAFARSGGAPIPGLYVPGSDLVNTGCFKSAAKTAVFSPSPLTNGDSIIDGVAAAILQRKRRSPRCLRPTPAIFFGRSGGSG